MASRVIHFEIQASDPQRAIDFYRPLFGWEFRAWDGPLDYWIIVTGPDAEPGIHGGLLRRNGPPPEGGQPVNAFVCTVGVENLAAALGQAIELGAEVAVDTMPIAGVGYLSYIKDPDGNLIGLMQADEKASADN